MKIGLLTFGQTTYIYKKGGCYKNCEGQGLNG